MFWVSLAIATAVGLAMAFVPLLGVHGVESALTLGVLLPPWVAALGAIYARRAEARFRGLDLMVRAVGAGLLVWFAPFAVLALNALRVPQCAPGQGLVFMLLGPAMGCALAACVGVWTAGLLGRRPIAPWVAAGIPITAIGLGLWLFYATPAIYVYGIFAGYFPGTIYDPVVEIPDSYLVYRALGLLLLVSLIVLFDACWDPQTRRLQVLARFRSHAGPVAFALVGLAVVVACYVTGEELGHRSASDYIAAELGKTLEGQACIVHMPRETDPALARRLVDDCDFQVLRTRALVDLADEAPITAFFFRNPDEKKRLMGAGRTFIAKPWRREVYLQMRAWPHPVLGHEIVHAVLGDVGRSPFHVAASWGGWLPNPGLIEGAAVALAWDVRQGLDPDQWARIMRDEDLLPSGEDLMSLRFTAFPARRAYAAAGSLIRFLIATEGVDAFLDAYRAGSIEGLASLESRWLSYLDDVGVSAIDRGIAEEALARQSIFSAVCPHQLAALRRDLSRDLAARDDLRVIETCESILEIDETDPHAHATLVGAYARKGRPREALAHLATLREHLEAPKPIVAAALEQYADANWRLGALGQASELYEDLLQLPQTDHTARGREVKRIALESDPIQRQLVFDLLVERPPPPVVVHLAQEIATERADGLGPYLEARQLLGQNRFDLALPLLERAGELGLPTERLRKEHGRLLATTLFAVGRYDDSKRAWTERLEIDPGAQAEARIWLERIEYAESRAVNPSLPGSSWVHRAVP